MRTRSFLLAAVLALTAAACGGDGEDAAASGDSAVETGDEGAGETADVAVATTDLGDVLVDADGMTLYLFTEDPEGASVCEDDCAAAWPPLTVDAEPVAGDGADQALLGTIERSDGSTQVTYAGAPLYTWASDSEPGDVTGQGVSDVWFVIGPDGDPITDAAGAAESGTDDTTDADGSADTDGSADELGY